MEACIHLSERYGDRYRITFDASHGARPRKPRDPWYLQIPCLHGHIYPHGSHLLGFASNKYGTIARKLQTLDGVEAHQDGDDGINVIFPEERFETVANIVKPKRRRRLSEHHRRRLAEGGFSYRFCGSNERHSNFKQPFGIGLV